MTVDLILGLVSVACGVTGLGLFVWALCSAAKQADRDADMALERRRLAAERHLRDGWER